MWARPLSLSLALSLVNRCGSLLSRIQGFHLDPPSRPPHLPPLPGGVDGGVRGRVRHATLHLSAAGRRWSSNPSGKCSYERPTRGTVCGTMRSMCGADAGCLAIIYQSLSAADSSPRSRGLTNPPRNKQVVLMGVCVGACAAPALWGLREMGGKWVMYARCYHQPSRIPGSFKLNLKSEIGFGLSARVGGDEWPLVTTNWGVPTPQSPNPKHSTLDLDP